MKLKKLLTMCLVAVMTLGVCFTVGCDKKDDNSSADAKVMNVSLNPSVEFILDGDDKVITVNALNEEGNLVITADVFSNIQGKTAEEAVQLFVQVSKETGYLVTGNASIGDNEISISVSGDTKKAEELVNSIKEKVSEYVNNLSESITLKIEQAKAITEAELEKLVEECAPYLEKAQIEAMKYEELVKTLIDSRKETCELYSQELKNAYYEAKAFALEQAKLEALKAKLPALQQAIFDSANQLYAGAIKSIEDTRYSLLVAEDSGYQQALKAVIDKKTEYIKLRNQIAQMEQSELSEAVMANLKAVEDALNLAEQALVSAGETANNTIDSIKAQLTSAHASVMEILASVDVNACLDEISAKQTEALDSFFTEFETNYKSAKEYAEGCWDKMADALTTPSESAE